MENESNTNNIKRVVIIAFLILVFIAVGSFIVLFRIDLLFFGGNNIDSESPPVYMSISVLDLESNSSIITENRYVVLTDQEINQCPKLKEAVTILLTSEQNEINMKITEEEMNCILNLLTNDFHEYSVFKYKEYFFSVTFAVP